MKNKAVIKFHGLREDEVLLFSQNVRCETTMWSVFYGTEPHRVNVLFGHAVQRHALERFYKVVAHRVVVEVEVTAG